MRERLRGTVLALALAVLVAMTALPVLAQEVEGPPPCPLSEGIVLVQGSAWANGFLVSHTTPDAAVREPIGDVAVPAGRYDVWLAAWDGHEPVDTDQQPEEQWFLEGLAEGTVVFSSAPTRDIADEESLVVQKVGANVDVAAFTSARARHAVYPDPDRNSVYPICAAFVAISDPEPEPEPEPEPDTTAIGDLVWDDANADGHQSDFEFGVPGVTVNLLNGAGVLVASTVTGAAGEYLFTGIGAGTFTVEIVLPDGYEMGPADGAGQVVLSSGQSDLTKDFGIFETPEVLPQVVTTTTAPPATTAPVTPETLPFTGVTTAQTGGVAAVLILLGALSLLVASARRRYDTR